MIHFFVLCLINRHNGAIFMPARAVTTIEAAVSLDCSHFAAARAGGIQPAVSSVDEVSSLLPQDGSSVVGLRSCQTRLFPTGAAEFVSEPAGRNAISLG